MSHTLPRADIVCMNSSVVVPPAGHYSHICTAAGHVYISGQLPIRPDGSPLTAHPFEEQTTQVLANIEACLACAGVGKDSLVQVRVYVTDIKHWPRFNELYAAWIGNHRPARAVAGVSQLHYGLDVEVEAVALAKPEVR
jgi:2-iminobutanoate/2-iminopropanoate deaminase